ncbi:MULTISPECIES: phage tail assembly chaperone [unclassified Clostridioides]|uniref:phage tail assembly chaperone n=1 Tax=unclassified Clostridioides TaxID=2635829 RepID=UPI001D0F744C|nr:hypothetical protein [Clostridioides sp. ES-W-0018-02]MCC0681056.1 hypothetical protein [Clostridioides sp. ES-S-0005-03]MCC0712746.1 hypothetical protein [Clostridioides sp. ES-W-0017-02]UDN47257.1 hypothetical protein JJJ25_17200 [Clostridioides sp. ES-S-0173-01]
MLDMDKRELENEAIEKDNDLDEEIEETNEDRLMMKEDEIIAKLLEDSPVPERTVFLERLGIPITLKALTEKEISKIRKDCTKIAKIQGRREEKLNDDEFNLALIEKGTVKPNFSNQKLLDAMKVTNAREFIKRKFLAGELSKISDQILELSGFYDEISDDDIKN